MLSGQCVPGAGSGVGTTGQCGDHVCLLTPITGSNHRLSTTARTLLLSGHSEPRHRCGQCHNTEQLGVRGAGQRSLVQYTEQMISSNLSVILFKSFEVVLLCNKL